MEIVSHQFTNRIKKGEEFVDIPPGTPFEVPADRAKEMIAGGRAEPFEGGEDAPVVSEDDTTGGAPESGAGEGTSSASTPQGGDGTPEADLEKITEAILNLDADNPEHFLGDGRPNVKAINELVAEDLGRSVTADERDAAWAALQPEA